MWLMLMLTSLTRRGGRAFVATPPRRCVSRVARGAAADGVDPLDVRRTALVAAIDAALTKEARKADALRKEAKAAADAEAMAHRANLIFSNLYRIEDGATQISVEDWENGGEVVEITLSPKFRSAKDEADAGFKKARRLRRGSAVVEELLEASSAKSTVLEGLRGDAVDADGDALEMLEGRNCRGRRGSTQNTGREEEEVDLDRPDLHEPRGRAHPRGSLAEGERPAFTRNSARRRLLVAR